ncbi:hypothetical protein IAU60_003186 [Kwoniella sp. DSM 27419]
MRSPLLALCLSLLVAPARADSFAGCVTSVTTHSALVQVGVNQLSMTCESTTFEFDQCYRGNTPVSPTTQVVPFASDCYQSCAYHAYAMITPDVFGNAFQCQCFDDLVMGSPATCDNSAQYLYTHPIPQASGLTRRRRRPATTAACPGRLTPCTIPSTDTYETELESCGGCLYGVYGNQTEAHGVDCSALPGTAFGATTCYQGRCEVFACEEGYQLVDGACQ